MVSEGTMVRAVKSVCEGQLMLYIYIYNPMLPPMYARISCLKSSNDALMLTLSRSGPMSFFCLYIYHESHAHRPRTRLHTLKRISI